MGKLPIAPTNRVPTNYLRTTQLFLSALLLMTAARAGALEGGESAGAQARAVGAAPVVERHVSEGAVRDGFLQTRIDYNQNLSQLLGENSSDTPAGKAARVGESETRTLHLGLASDLVTGLEGIEVTFENRKSQLKTFATSEIGRVNCDGSVFSLIRSRREAAFSKSNLSMPGHAQATSGGELEQFLSVPKSPREMP